MDGIALATLVQMIEEREKQLQDVSVRLDHTIGENTRLTRSKSLIEGSLQTLYTLREELPQKGVDKSGGSE